MRVLVAPDKFRGTLTAAEAARAIAIGWHRVRSDDEVMEVPMADGGEGSLEVLSEALGADPRRVRVTGPLGDPVDAEFAIVPARGVGTRAVVEMARASGLELLRPDQRDALRASTYGTGELISAAVRAGAREVIVCIGGSATTDGGAGMAQALGARLLDEKGSQIPRGGAGLLGLARIDVTTLEPSVRDVRFVCASDVDNPLLGPNGAARAFALQKGASPDEVLVLDRALAHFAAIVQRDLLIDVRDQPGAGAAGGLGAGLSAFLGARTRLGVEIVMEAVGFERKLAAADIVVTGEGQLDGRSLRGKVPSGVLTVARASRTPAIVLAGRVKETMPGAAVVASLVDRFGEERAITDARGALEDLAAEVARANLKSI